MKTMKRLAIALLALLSFMTAQAGPTDKLLKTRASYNATVTTG